MFCVQCGTEVADTANFCGKCGNTMEGNAPPANPAPPPPPGMTAPPPPPPPAPAPLNVAPAAAPQQPAYAAHPQATPFPGLTPPGVEMVIVNWKAAPGKHPTTGRGNYNVTITDKRIFVEKAGLLGRLGKGLELGGALGVASSAITAGIAQVAVGAVVAGLGSAMNRSTWPEVNEKRNVASAELDQMAAQRPEMRQYPNQAIVQVRMKKGGILGQTKCFIQLPEGEFMIECELYKDCMKAFAQVFPGRLVSQ
jgi:zinc-ribbon domain